MAVNPPPPLPTPYTHDHLHVKKRKVSSTTESPASLQFKGWGIQHTKVVTNRPFAR